MAKKITFLKGTLCIYKSFIVLIYTFFLGAKEKLQKCAPILDGFCVENCHVLSRFLHLRERIHDLLRESL